MSQKYSPQKLKNKILPDIVTIARQAGDIIKKNFGKRITYTAKSSERDLVSNVDIKCQQKINQFLFERFPHHRILGEESSENKLGHPDSEWIWHVDPLDGTTNFIYGIPLCAVSIALSQNYIPQLGIIYDPFRDELFTAVKGMGAYLNYRKINVSKATSLFDGVVGSGIPHTIGNTESLVFHHIPEIGHLAKSVRALGTAALALAYVASGRFLAYWGYYYQSWDLAAGILLVEEAGGKVTDHSGNPYFLGVGPLVATNNNVHKTVVKCLQYYDKKKNTSK